MNRPLSNIYSCLRLINTTVLVNRDYFRERWRLPYFITRTRAKYTENKRFTQYFRPVGLQHVGVRRALPNCDNHNHHNNNQNGQGSPCPYEPHSDASERGKTFQKLHSDTSERSKTLQKFHSDTSERSKTLQKFHSDTSERGKTLQKLRSDTSERGKTLQKLRSDVSEGDQTDYTV